MLGAEKAQSCVKRHANVTRPTLEITVQYKTEGLSNPRMADATPYFTRSVVAVAKAEKTPL